MQVILDYSKFKGNLGLLNDPFSKTNESLKKKKKKQLGVLVHTYKASPPEAEGGQDCHEFEVHEPPLPLQLRCYDW